MYKLFISFIYTNTSLYHGGINIKTSYNIIPSLLYKSYCKDIFH